MSSQSRRLDSVCVYCGSSNAAPVQYLQAASTFGAILAAEGVRLVYGGGGVGLMGATARAAHAGGGRVLGVIPQFLTSHERPLGDVETIIVQSMHERKMIMYEAADAFAVLPGAIGTLEEVIELLSWRRLGLHAKPIVFYNPDGFWDLLFRLFHQIVDANLLPTEFADTWRSVERIEDLLPTLRSMPTEVFASPPGMVELL
ncbi:MAG TPA: TIGR00730 family Rossman fold protein [Caulobacteraceae bacterium]|nr:TIGR00730 family Rossman fold protein [Caulobacteraceae bacterium]